MHIIINRISWNVTLDDRTHFLISALFSRGDTPTRPTFTIPLISSLLMEFKVLHLHYCLFVLGPLSVLRQGPRPNIYSWASYPYKEHVAKKKNSIA